MGETLRLGATKRRLDVLAVQQGVEHECPLRPGLFVTILPAGMFNPRFARAAQAALEQLVAEGSKNGKAKDGVKGAPLQRFEDPEFIERALVASIRGIYRADGTEVVYTSEVGLAVLSDPGNADVLAWIVLKAQEYGRYYDEEVEADAKNSLPDSSGKQAGVGASETTPS